MIHTPRALPGILLTSLIATLSVTGPSRSADAASPWTDTWGTVLTRHTQSVKSTVGTEVDYRALRAGPAAGVWKALVADLAAAQPPADGDAAMAFWIDAYNVLAIDTVLRAWPVDSIRDAGNLLWPVWKRDAGVAAGRPVTLHEIEHEILRSMGDPRIHSAIVCASTSCPSLRRAPFSGGDLDAALDDTMRAWLASPTKGMRVDRARRRITVSKIFDWFADDFDAVGGVRAVLARYAPEADRAWLAANGADAPLDYFDYDWRLNDWNRPQAATTLRAP